MSAVVAYFLSGFFFAHLAIAVVSVILLVRQSKRMSALKHMHARQISEAELRRHVYPVEVFDRYFDYCSSAFIFVGLVGTMSGFIQAVPELQNPKYDFHHLRDALAVSAFGIVWSAALVGVVSARHYFVIAPRIEKLMEIQHVSELAQMLAEQLDKFGAQIAGTLERGLTNFSSAAQQLAAAAQRLSAAADGAGASFGHAAGELTRTASTVAGIYESTEKLPQMVTAELTRVFDSHNLRIQETLNAQAGHLQLSSDALREALRSEQTAWETARKAAAAEGRTRLREFFAELQKGYQDVLLEEQDKLAKGSAEAVDGVRRMLKEYEDGLNGAGAKLPADILRAHRLGLQSMDRAATRLEAIAREQVKSAETLERAGLHADAALGKLEQSVEKLARGLGGAENDWAAVHRRLDELVASLGGHPNGVPPRGREAGGKWWPWT